MNIDIGKTKRFLVAAKLAELHTFEQLSTNCTLVSYVCDVIHELQKERGVSNVYLASRGGHFSLRRSSQILQSEEKQNQLLSLLQNKFLEQQLSKDNHRLLIVTSIALQGIDGLVVLREQIEKHTITPLQSTQAFCRLIASLLDIIFEAVDIASEPDITKALVSLFNFLQAKEYAGQERAWGAIGFAKTHFTKILCERLSALQNAQDTSIKVFIEYANKDAEALWNTLQTQKPAIELNQFRNMIKQLADGAPIASEISEVWYDVTTTRIDEMHTIEQHLTQYLLVRAQECVKISSKELSDFQQNTKMQTSDWQQKGSPLTVLFDTNLPGLMGENRVQDDSNENDMAASVSLSTKMSEHRSFYDLLKSQSTRIDTMQAELELAKKALKDQQKVSRAKLYLMQQLGVSENEAHKKLQKAAMNQSASIVSVAEKVLQSDKSIKP